MSLGNITIDKKELSNMNILDRLKYIVIFPFYALIIEFIIIIKLFYPNFLE